MKPSSEATNVLDLLDQVDAIETALNKTIDEGKVKFSSYKESFVTNHILSDYFQELISNLDKPNDDKIKEDNNRQELKNFSRPTFFSVKTDGAWKLWRSEARCPGCNLPMAWAFNESTSELSIGGQSEKCSENVFKFEVNFPTGQIIYGDWPAGMNEICKANEDRKLDSESVNYNIGKEKTSRKYAEIGVLHCFVGNTCPEVYQRDDKSIFCSTDNFVPDGHEVSYKSSEPDDDPDEDDWKEISNKSLGSICTDLWWATLIDVQTWEEELTKARKSEEEIAEYFKEVEVFSIEPGRYEVEYHHSVVVNGKKTYGRYFTCRKIT